MKNKSLENQIILASMASKLKLKLMIPLIAIFFFQSHVSFSQKLTTLDTLSLPYDYGQSAAKPLYELVNTIAKYHNHKVNFIGKKELNQRYMAIYSINEF